MTPANEPQKSSSHIPFWNPWGALGCLWRSVVFLLGMLLLCFLFAVLFRGCQEPENPGGGEPPVDLPTDPYEDIRDTSLVRDWADSIPDIPELPSPEENFVPPLDSASIIVNPDDSLSQIVGDQLVVFFNSTDLQKDMVSFAKQFKQLYPSDAYKVLYCNPGTGTMLLGVPETELLKVADELPEKITDIDFIVATNEILNESSKPSDPGFSNVRYDEYFKLIQAYDAWDITKGSKDIKVAILDTYFDLSNPEIADRVVDQIHIPSKTRNVLPPAKEPRNDDDFGIYSHGSHVAGIAIGGQNNKLGCSGIAPECSWIPVSLGDQLQTVNVMEGLLYAIYHGADVVNISLGRLFPKGIEKTPLADQIRLSEKTDRRGEALWNYLMKIANDHKCVIVKAAGNETILMGLDPKNRGNEFIKVEAVDGKGIAASFSNFGKAPEANLNYSTVAAPGVKLWSVMPKTCAKYARQVGIVVADNDDFQEMDGTSMAAPVVTGAVALLKSKNKDLTTEQVIDILVSTAKQTDTKHRIGPTIQLKDALDATGGEKLNFDDLMKDHNLLIGKWKSTYELSLTKVETGELLDKMWVYFIFPNTSSGTIELHALNRKKVYTANVDVKWGSNSVSFIQRSDAVAPDGDRVNKDDFVCHPNSQRLLETSCQRNGKERYTFLLEKVK